MKNDEDIKKMATLLKSGAIMLADTCPVCGSPLFKLRSGQVICPHCDLPVVYLKEGESETIAVEPYILNKTKDILLKKLQQLTSSLDQDPENMSSYLALISEILEAIRDISALQGGAKANNGSV
ncbi:MAG: Sjogren's syndrome/scleroderma autoantigen 1 family protein [Thermoprotei archaeon]